MKKRLISVLAFALAVSAGAAFVLYQLIASKVDVGSSAKQPVTKVFVAARDLELGALVTEKEVRTQDYLTPPVGAITKKEDLIGRGIVSPVHQDSAFFEAALAPKGAGAGFAATIPKGMRAFAVHVNEVVGVAGFAVAGARVDVLVSGAPQGPLAESVGAITRTLLQNIEVLSAGQNFQKDAEGKPVLVQVVNLLVTPEQAERLNLATDNKIQLVLRNPADREIVVTPGASTAGLFAGAAIPMPKFAGNSSRFVTPEILRHPQPVPQPLRQGEVSRRYAAPEPPRTVTIEVISGDKKSQSTFPDAAVPGLRDIAAKSQTPDLKTTELRP
jgi:pilus assembly protein CpaB